MLLLCLMAPLAWAHTLSVSHVDIAFAANGRDATIELDLALRDLALTLPLDADHDERVTWGELRGVRPQLERLVVEGVALTVDDVACTLAPKALATRRYDDGTYATLVLSARCPAGVSRRLHYGLFFARDPQHRALASVRDGALVGTVLVRAGRQDVDLPRGRGRPFTDFLREGVHHILIGYDHLAFLLALLLPAALVRVGRTWQPAPTLRTALGHVLAIVTSFTLAHSITLTLAALGWVAPSSRWVEAAIAASVIVAALNNVWPLVTQRAWAIAFGFGLVHGFGFAGALGELGLPRGARLQALVGFNLGVEIGQLAVVAVVLPPLYLLRLRAAYPRVAMPVLSLAVAGLAGWWLWKRLAWE